MSFRLTSARRKIKVKTVQNNGIEWVLYARLTIVMQASVVRIVIKDVNNGRWYDDYDPLPAAVDVNGTPTFLQYGSSLRPTLYELEAYGPGN